MEAELKSVQPDIDIKLIKGSGGVFEVICDGKMIFSKLDHNEHRFPKKGEISSLMNLDCRD